MFLPDRYIKGQCPRCDAHEQYGDNCEQCGHTYTPTDLKNPYSVLSNTPPIQKESLHYFFALKKQQQMIERWLKETDLQDAVRNKLQEWLHDGLRDWDISRDEPYFGIAIPDAPGKYFYVWLDAPIGDLSALQEYLHKHEPNTTIESVWGEKSPTKIIHFIGKDIIYFHGLFWPAVLEGAGYHQPDAIYAHGFLTINGQKMSKSRGTFITAQQYLAHLEPENFRYFLPPSSIKVLKTLIYLGLNLEMGTLT